MEIYAILRCRDSCDAVSRIELDALSGFRLTYPPMRFKIVTICSVLSVTFTTGIFLCYAWALFLYFPSDGKFSWRLKAISVLSALNFATFVLLLFTRTLDPLGAILGISIQMSSAALFAWAIKSTYRRRLSVAYNTDIPKFILESGPFGVVRHPFYTSYILFWLSFVVMQPALINGLMALLLFGLYLNAALFEETKFARSALSSAYQDYLDRTGMFLPRISLLIK
jgi:protein-S-isoprenylcysteine O-methyltransferase Ste14